MLCRKEVIRSSARKEFEASAAEQDPQMVGILSTFLQSIHSFISSMSAHLGLVYCHARYVQTEFACLSQGAHVQVTRMLLNGRDSLDQAIQKVIITVCQHL